MPSHTPMLMKKKIRTRMLRNLLKIVVREDRKDWWDGGSPNFVIKILLVQAG